MKDGIDETDENAEESAFFWGVLHEGANPDFKKINSDPIVAWGFLAFCSSQKSPKFFSVSAGH